MLMTFFQFALNNVRRNGRAYAAYFLSSAFAILMFFLYATPANHPGLHQGYVSQIATKGMEVAEYIIFVFSFFSILYSMGSFLRRRNHEFGILTILGISNWQLIWLIFLENMLLGIAAIIASMIVGLIASKLFLMLGSVVLDIPPCHSTGLDRPC
jgi:putative ABC transport system permease protein